MHGKPCYTGSVRCNVKGSNHNDGKWMEEISAYKLLTIYLLQFYTLYICFKISEIRRHIFLDVPDSSSFNPK